MESAAVAGSLRLLLLPLVIVAFLGFLAAPALAAKTHRLITTFDISMPKFSTPNSIAVDDASGNVFIAEYFDKKIVITGAEGGLPSDVAVAEISGLTDPTAVAVDNAAVSPSKGAVYVSEESGVLKKFILNPLSEEYELEKELSALPTLGHGLGLAVDSKGDVFVADSDGEAVVEFDPTGSEVSRLDVSVSVGVPIAVAVDSAGDLIVSDNERSIFRFDANGSGEVEPGTVPVRIVEPGRAEGMVVDLSTDDLYVSVFGEGVVPRVIEFSASCTTEGEGKKEHCLPAGEFGAGAIQGVGRVGVNATTGHVYVVDRHNGAGGQVDLAVFGPNVIVPGAVSGKATGVTGASATLNGTVDPSGSAINECRFEWGESTTYGTIAPCAESPAAIGSGSSPVAVHAELPGLGLGTTYHFRLVATNANTVPNEKGPSVGEDESLTTLGPQVHGESVSQVSDTTAKLEGILNPEGEVTSYAFEYVSDADFEASKYASAISVPLGGEEIGSGIEDVEIAQLIDGLSPLTVYHFRIAATNVSGTAHGPDRTFMTYLGAPAALPDGRVFEQVSPVDKNGVAPSGSSDGVQVAPDGNAITYASGGGIPGTEGAQQYPTYVASRGADWSTRGLLPPASGGSSAKVLGWGEDLSQAYVLQGAFGSPFNFLQRENATGLMRAIAGELAIDSYIGASEDSSVVVFESSTKLLEGASTKGPNTYVWDRDSGLRLAGVFNNGSAPFKGAVAGSNELSSRSHYTQAEHTLSADGSRVFFKDAGLGQLYVRLNPTEPQSAFAGAECTEAALACTVQISASQRAVADPNGTKAAAFWAATPDGSAAFFTSPGKLTDDATTGAADKGNDLYRYDTESGELIDVAPDAGDPNGAEVQGVLGASPNGSYVYFVANGKLGAAPAQGSCDGGGGICNLYVWHEGSVTFIAQLLGAGDRGNWLSPPTSNGQARTSRVSADGQNVLFLSRRQIGDYDNHGFAELYRYQVGDTEPQCVSCNPTGAAPTGSATLQSVRTSTTPGLALVLTRNLSADGNRVFFETPDKLVANDVNGDGECHFLNEVNKGGIRSCQDVYEWEASGAGSCDGKDQNGGCLYLLSSGTSPEPSYFADADAEGGNAFLFTAQQLVGQDKDQIIDIYDARVSGGIASQNPPVPPVPCEGEACKGPVPIAPASESVGSASFTGPGDPKPSRHSKKRHHKKKQQHKKRKATHGKHG